ncbi:MAG: UvrD-helicase domain-containing protein, partial [Actinomycetota bacterium]|nr:UvrD-helicase domain-containing protein [Actinomycetota bacterium]
AALAAATDGKGRTGNKAHWVAHGGAEALERLRVEEAALTFAANAWQAPWREYRRLVVGAVAAEFVLSGAIERAAAGTLEFHDLLVVARRLLATNSQARRLLHERYQRVLLDEFQDTDPIQLEIAVRLTAAPDAQADDSTTLRPRPGRLFVVGDPKQSIYRFRRADIAVYLAAARQIGAEPVALAANFRSTAAVIGWVNGVFSEVIRAEPAVQPAYAPLAVARSGPRDHGTVTVIGADGHVDGDERISADELRRRESADVAAVIATALREGWAVGDGAGGLRRCEPGDIAVLLPARTTLPMLEAALGELAVPYRAENASVVYMAPEVRAVMLALRAAADPTDQLALVAALRTQLYGCSDVDLYDWKVAGGRWNPFAPVPEGAADQGVAAALAHVRSIAGRIGREGPADLLDAIIEERRVLETALAGPDARDVWRRLRYVVDQARAWTDAGGRGIRRYLRWAQFQAGEARASDTILPERDQRAVRIMTVHAAKGLEFPITVVAGMTTQVQRRTSMSVVWPDSTWTLAERDDELFEAFRPIDEQMGDAERRRLLYVACTRAVDHLVVSLHRRRAESGDGDGGTAQYTSAVVLAEAGAVRHGARSFTRGPALDAVAGTFAEPLVLPWADEVSWSEERQRAIAAGSRRSATSATPLAAQPARVVADEDDRADVEDAGLRKDGVDLDLPPWQRGRYGTAIGRAVHAVLQDADLAAGGDIDRLAAMQCAAEGIFGLEHTVAGLSRSALHAPIVRAAAGGAEHWRELFVVAETGGIVLEGYIDLLVRTPAGLVIVDYKTDRWPNGGDQAARIARYRLQLAAYGVALGRLLDEPVVGGLLVHCLPDGPAEQIDVDDWTGAVAAVATRTA